MTTLTWGIPTLPSALQYFTSEFGMGSGGTIALLSPKILLFTKYTKRMYLVNKNLAVTYSHMGNPHTTIGITTFHF